MEEKEKREQPEKVFENAQATEVEKVEANEPENEKEVRDFENFNGSLGKFKDTESLLKAYNCLQAEFTKKCQALSELKAKMAPTPEVPIYEKENWVEKVSKFLSENEDAKPFAKQIAESILSDEELAKKENALELAWAKVASSKYVSPQKLVEDENFINNYVLNSEKIKNIVLNEYFEKLKSTSAPKVMTSSTGGFWGSVKPKQPLTLSEAKEMARNFFE